MGGGLTNPLVLDHSCNFFNLFPIATYRVVSVEIGKTTYIPELYRKVSSSSQSWPRFVENVPFLCCLL